VLTRHSYINQNTCTGMFRRSVLQRLGRTSRLTPRRVSPMSTRTWRYSYLSRHPGESKPQIPYQPGVTLTAQAYAPPAPPKFHYSWAEGKVEEDIASLHPLQACLAHPPAEGTPGKETVGLRIQRPIRVRDPSNSQLVQVEVVNQDGNDAGLSAFHHSTGVVAAKFYDPLYYEYDDGRPDPFANSDAAFAHETMAYHHLQPVYGILVPRFLGPYSVNIPIPGNIPSSRPVRCILYEYVPGTALHDTEIEDYSTSQQQAIMSAILDAHSILWQMDVSHRDLHPRNVIVVSAVEGQKADVRLIDFNMARCGQRAERKGHVPSMELESRSAIVNRWRDEDMRHWMIDFAWLVDWPWNEWLENEYAKDRTRRWA
jgi:serine/threonine protein kinase